MRAHTRATDVFETEATTGNESVCKMRSIGCPERGASMVVAAPQPSHVSGRAMAAAARLWRKSSSRVVSVAEPAGFSGQYLWEAVSWNSCVG